MAPHSHSCLRHENLGKDYYIHTLCTKPQDLGFHAVSRERNYHLLVHKKFGKFVGDPSALYARMSEKLEVYTDLTLDSLFWESDPDELKKELLSSLSAKRLQQSDNGHELDFRSMLTNWERAQLDSYEKQWVEKHGSSMQDAVFNLSQSASQHKSWTCATKQGFPSLPTLCLDLYIYIFFVCHLPTLGIVFKAKSE